VAVNKEVFIQVTKYRSCDTIIILWFSGIIGIPEFQFDPEKNAPVQTFKQYNNKYVITT
jgi:hypothetical protein